MVRVEAVLTHTHTHVCILINTTGVYVECFQNTDGNVWKVPEHSLESDTTRN